MRRLVILLCIAAAAGCVPQRQFDDMKSAHRKSQEQVIDLKSRLEESNLRIDQLGGGNRNDPHLLTQISNLESENDTLRQKLADIEQALEQIGPIGPLPAELDEALMQLAQSNPDLVTYDPNRGMVKLRSELTFDLGSAAVKPAAASSLDELAQIINAPVAAPYELRIVGHTDNVRIRRAQTLKQHATNWHLSVHRAISVKDVLAKGGVPQERMGIAGYGEHRPIAENRPKGGNELNRRVEIFLVQRIDRSAMNTAKPHPVKAPVASDAIEMNVTK